MLKYDHNRRQMNDVHTHTCKHTSAFHSHHEPQPRSKCTVTQECCTENSNTMSIVDIRDAILGIRILVRTKK